MKQINENTGKEHPVTILVNNKSVEVMGPKATGLEVKQAVLAAGLNVQLDFLLSLERANGEYLSLGDGDVITVNPQSVFNMVSPDHNS